MPLSYAGAVPVSRPHVLLAAGMTDGGEPALSALLPVPIGPGPGVPGVGGEPMYPIEGTRFAASPGSLPAGLGPGASGYGLGAVGERMRAGADRVRIAEGGGR
jgi:hypothetical protein